MNERFCEHCGESSEDRPFDTDNPEYCESCVKRRAEYGQVPWATCAFDGDCYAD
jgi:hypothetical protein